jgi:uncharacterized membrane protein
VYELIRDLHLYSIAPCLPLGFYLIIVSDKGGVLHKKIGYVYMVLIFFSSIISLFLKAYVGATFLNHFGWIHLLSFLTIWTVPRSLIAVKKGNIQRHKRSMKLLYWTGLLLAGLFTLMPGRYLHSVLFE